MSASFECHGVLYYGWNGLILELLDVIERTAIEDYGVSHPIVRWCGEEKKKFFPGAIVCLDPLTTKETGLQLVAVLMKSATLVSANPTTTQTGINWINHDFLRLVNALKEQTQRMTS